MSNDPVDGGTVTARIEGQIVAVDFEAQTITLSFADDARVPLTGDATVTFATVPEPAPLVVTCKDPECPYPGDCFGVKENGRTTWRWPRELVERYHPDAVWPQPEQDDTASGIDFDALPIGTVLDDCDGSRIVKRPDGWFIDEVVTYDLSAFAPYSVVYQPAPMSPGECLRGLLAGRDDADELIEEAKQWRHEHGHSALSRWVVAVGDAARSGSATDG